MSFYEQYRESSNNLFFYIGKNTFPSHFHLNLEFIYCLEKNLTVVVDNKEIKLCKNQLLIIDSYVIHTIIGTENCIAMVVPLIYLNDFFRIRKDKIFEKTVVNDETSEIYSLMLKIQKSFGNNYLINKGIIEYFIGIIISKSNLIACKNKKELLIINIIKYINEHYKEKINLDFIADKFSYSKYTISHYFNSQVGMNLNSYVNYVRMNNFNEKNRSAERIKVTQLASDCGFDSLQTFYRNYKKKFGASPIRKNKGDI